MLIKRCVDLIASALGLVLLSPVLLACAIWVKLDSRGGALYWQERVGRHGRLFLICKIRTMHVNTESQGQITVGNDARVTRCGQFLRKTKLDELPQLWNVLRGEMSLVGPRPEVPKYVAYYPEELRRLVLSVAPGITDRASIEFKNESSILGQAADPERAYIEEILPIKLDYYVRYVRERSLSMDLGIIWATLKAIC